MRLLAYLEKNRNYWYLLGILVFFFFLRLPSLFEPYWYGDEGIYEVLGSGLRHGQLLYRDVWDNKPPLLYIVYALLGAQQFPVRFASLLAGLGAVTCFFFLAKQLFSHTTRGIYWLPLFATITFALLFGTPLIEGNIANAENFMLLPILGAAVIITHKTTSRRPSLFVFAGVLLGIATLFKVVAVFDTAAICCYLLFFSDTTISWQKRLQFLFLLGGGFALPLIITVFYFLLTNTFVDFYKASFTQMVGYVSYGNTFLFQQGLLFIKGILLLGIFLFLLWKKKIFTKEACFICIWTACSLFNAFFAQRPYTHYVLVLLPSCILFFFLVFTDTIFSQQTQKNIQRLGQIVAISIVVLIFGNFHFYNKTLAYYSNAFSYLFLGKDTAEYQAFFDKKTPRDYEIAQFINAKKKQDDGLFIWGNNAQVYILTKTLPPGRFTVAYHMTANEQTMREAELAVQKKRPRFIIVTDQQHAYPFSLNGYIQTFVIKGSTIYEKAF